jgi:hypothetical protein
MMQCKERSATSLAENLERIIACGTFRSGRLIRVLMTFLNLAGSSEHDLSIMADGSTTWSREWMQSGIKRSKGTLQCSDFALFLEFSGAAAGVMWMDSIETT